MAPAYPPAPAQPTHSAPPQAPGYPQAPPQQAAFQPPPVHAAPAQPVQHSDVPRFGAPVEAAAALPPQEPTGGASTRKLPSPLLLGLLVVVLVGFVAWKFVLQKDDASTAVAPTPVANTQTPAGAAGAAATPTGRPWAAAVPKTRPGASTDANSLDAREVAPARFEHQVKLAQKALAPGEGIRLLTVQSDGTIVVLAVKGTAARWIATKKDLTPAILPTGEALASLAPLAASEIKAQVPAKLLSAVARAKGIAPVKLVLGHPVVTPSDQRAISTGGGTAATSALFGSGAFWTVKWPGVVGAIVASGDGHKIKAVG